MKNGVVEFVPLENNPIQHGGAPKDPYQQSFPYMMKKFNLVPRAEAPLKMGVSYHTTHTENLPRSRNDSSERKTTSDVGAKPTFRDTAIQTGMDNEITFED